MKLSTSRMSEASLVLLRKSGTIPVLSFCAHTASKSAIASMRSSKVPPSKKTAILSMPIFEYTSL